MRAQVRNLAEMVKLRKQAGSGSSCIVMLGAGASLGSGVPSTPTIMRELVERFDQGSAGDLGDRFDALWRRSSPEDRRLFLSSYLDKSPSPGYQKLALAAQAGYFDLIVTFNFDDLVEKALRAIGFTDFRVVVHGETGTAEVAALIDKPVARLTILKLHGSLTATDHFLFAYDEMANYPPDLEALLLRLTRRPIIVCGYAFNDLCVIKAFATEGGTVICVNPSGAPSNLKSILAKRQSLDHVIDGESGKFDRFFTSLHEELTSAGGTVPARRPRWNPFKFLDSYDVSDRDWFFGRRELTRNLVARFNGEERPAALHLVGLGQAGKTSFVRAGLLAHLDSETFEPPIYLRCRPELERQLCDLVAQRPGSEPGASTLEEALAALGAGPKHTVLVLDQFERMMLPHSRDDRGWQLLVALFKGLCQHSQPRLTVVFVTLDTEGLYYKLLFKSRLAVDVDEIEPLPPRRIGAIIRLAAWKSGFSFDPQIIDTLIEELQDPGIRFSLAHLQALCYLLVKGSCTEWWQYKQLNTMDLRSALDSAINASDFLNYVEDLPLKEGRCLLRSLMMVVSEPGKQQIAAFLKERFADVLQSSPYPEPL
jgi:hypothetical protein